MKDLNYMNYTRNKKILFFVLILCTQIISCAKETNPKKAFDNGDYKTSFDIWTIQAKQGNVEAQNYIGIHYYVGLGVDKDYQKAFMWYEKAAKAGNLHAQRNIADMYNYARGVKKDIYLAFMWYFASYQQGNDRAKSQIDNIIALGQMSPNMQLHAKIASNEYITDKENHFNSYDTYIEK